MMKINQIINVVFILLTIILNAIPQCLSTLSDKQLCYDPDCSEPISLAKTKSRYYAKDEGILSFDINTQVTVYSKHAGLRNDLWGVEINGKRGYAPEVLLLEYKVIRNNLTFEVPIKSPVQHSKTSDKKLEHKKGKDKLKSITENVEASSVPITTIDIQSAKELPNNITPTHEVIDGTTLHLNPTKTFTQTSATEVPQKPVVPNKEEAVVNFKVDSNREDHKTNIFVKDGKLQHKILNGKEEDSEQNNSQKDNTNDVIKSPETSLGDIIGVKIPTLGIGGKLINHFFKTADEKVETVENETTSEVLDVQLSNEQSESEEQDVKIPKEEVPNEAQTLQLTKEQSVSKVQNVKVAKEQDVEVAKEQDAKVTKEQDVNVTKEQGVKVSKEQVSPQTQDVQLSKEESVSEVQDAKVSKEQVPSETPNVQLTKEKSVSEVQDAKVSKEQVPPETPNVQLTKEKSVSEVQDAKVPNEQVLSETSNVQLTKEKSVSEVQDAKVPNEQVLSETSNVQLTKEKSVSKVQDAKVSNEQVPSETQNVELSKEKSVSEVQNAKVAKEQDAKVKKEQDVNVTKEQDVKVIKEQDVKVTKEQDVKVTNEQDVKVTKEQDVKVTKEQDVKVSNEQVPPEIPNVQLTKEKSVSEVQDAKVSNEQIPSETQNVELSIEKSVSEVQNAKVSNEQVPPEIPNVQLTKEKSVSEVQDAKVSNEQIPSETQNVELSIEKSVSEVQNAKVSNEQVPPEIPNVQLTKEKSVSEVQDAKVSNEQVLSETPNVQLTKEKSVSKVQDAKVSNEQVPSETQNVELSKEKSVSEMQGAKVSNKQVPPEIPNVQLTKEKSVSEVQDAKVSNEQVPPEISNLQLTKEKSVSEVQDPKVSNEQVPPEISNVQLTKEKSVPEVQGVKATKEGTILDVQVVESQEKHSTDYALHVSTSIDNREEQTDNILNTTVASTAATVLNETGHTNLVQTMSTNSFEIDAIIARNITEPTNTEYVHFVENTQFDTRQAKLVENGNVSESNSTILGIKHDVPVPTGTDVYSSTELPSLNVDRNIAQQSSNINFDTASHQSDSIYHSGNVEININSQDTQVNEENTIATGKEEDSNELQKKVEADVKYENQNHSNENVNATESEVGETPVKPDILEKVINLNDNSDSAKAHHEYIYLSENVASINEFRNRNLLNAHTEESHEIENMVIEETEHPKNEALLEHKDDSVEETPSESISSPEVCAADNVECFAEIDSKNNIINHDETSEKMENIIESLSIVSNSWMTFMYLIITAIATLIFSLGYYYIENMRRDGQLIAKINKLEKDLLVSTKESSMLKENLKITKDKLTCIEDESFGSNEMVLSLKTDLEASQNAKSELEDQVSMLEKDLESATEAGLELERMLREVLSSDNEDNPLAKSVEDLQTRLNAQQAANESLTSALNIKTQENGSLSAELASFKKKCEELEVQLIQVTNNLKVEVESKNTIQQMLTVKVHELEIQLKDISNEKIALQKQLECKEMVTQDLMDVINQSNSNLDLDKLYNATHIKAEAKSLLEERNELKIRLTEVEGAHSLLEEHMKVIKEEVSTLSEQCKVAEKEKKDAETRLEVLSNFFKEREAQRQKEESIWLQQQGEVVSTVERIQTMQSEIQNYKQQIEMLKREILDQEREYENQISIIETKAREQWIKARQVERRLEESKVEAGQLRNRLTLIEKNINDIDPEAKLHRMEANGETATSPPLFIGAESSNSPIMFSGSSNVPPPPPPSYLHSLFPPYLPPPLPNSSNVPPYEISQRPPPLGGRLSSPPPMPLHPPNSSRYDNTGSPPPISPHLLPSFPNLRIPPPPFGNDHMPGPPPPPLGSIMPAPLGTAHSWGEEPLTPLRNSGYHLSQRERVRNHKGSLHSSGESLDKSHHNSKV